MASMAKRRHRRRRQGRGSSLSGRHPAARRSGSLMPITDTPPAGRTGAVLFDVDGTLIDSSYLHTVAWWQAFRQYGYDVPMASIHRSWAWAGTGSWTACCPEDRDRAGDADIMASHGARVRHPLALAARARRRTGPAGAVPSTAGLAVALASSARDRDLEICAPSSTPMPTSTPPPARPTPRKASPPRTSWSRRWTPSDVPAADAVYVGDAVWDMKAAAALDIPAIGVTCGGTSEAELREAGAVEVYESPRALLENLAGSAIGRLAAQHPRRLTRLPRPRSALLPSEFSPPDRDRKAST